MIGRERISKRNFYNAGGLSHPDLFRKGARSGWSYWRIRR